MRSATRGGKAPAGYTPVREPGIYGKGLHPDMSWEPCIMKHPEGWDSLGGVVHEFRAGKAHSKRGGARPHKVKAVIVTEPGHEPEFYSSASTAAKAIVVKTEYIYDAIGRGHKCRGHFVRYATADETANRRPAAVREGVSIGA